MAKQGNDFPKHCTKSSYLKQEEINDLTVEWSFFWNEKEINGALLACECENEDDAVIAEVKLFKSIR